MVYPGNRRFLGIDDTLRKDKVNFPTKAPDKRKPPDLKTNDYIDSANTAYAEATGKARLSLVQKTGCKGRYAFRRLLSHDRFLCTPVDPMHLLKNIAEHCVKFVTGVEDSIKVRKEEKNLGRFKAAWVEDDRKKLLHAPFALSNDEVLLADRRAGSVSVPSSFDWRPRQFFSNTTGMKAHEWQEVATNGILKFCLRV